MPVPAHYVLTERITGFELNRPGFFSLVLPEATTNLVTNPSLETATTGYTLSNGASIAQSSVRQWRGGFSLAITPSTNVNSGAYYSLTLTTGSTYTASLAFWGAPGVPYRIAIADNSAVILNRTTFYGRGTWERVWVNAPVTSTATYRIYFEKDGSSSTAVFYVDALQVEAKAYPTTYCDGDQIGLVATRKDYLWTGTPHASTSTRSAQCRNGGTVIKLSSLGLRVAAYLGLGMAAISNIVQPAGLSGGSYYQTTLPQDRTFQLVGQFEAGTLPQLQRLRTSLEDVLRPNVTDPPQPMLLLYQALDNCGNAIGSPLEISCSYNGGMEGQTDSLYGEPVTLSFINYLSLIRSSADTAQSLTMALSVASNNYIIQRSAGGVWSNMGTGAASADVNSLVYLQNGNLVAGGQFTGMGGIANTQGIAQWSGSAWSAIGTGVNAGVGEGVEGLAVGPDGTLYAVGTFTAMGGVANTQGVARWSGSAWSGMGATGTNANAYAITVGPDGSVYAGGAFTNIGGVAANRIARWNGSAWVAMGTGAAGGDVLAIAVGWDGSVYAAGSFTSMGGVADTARIARWNGSAWVALSTGMNGQVNALAIAPNGTLYAGGAFTTAGPITANRVARWNGVSWSALGTGTSGAVHAIVVSPSGLIYIGGDFLTAGGITLADRGAVWTGSAWASLDVDFPSTAYVNAFLFGQDGTLTIGHTGSGTTTTSAVTTATTNGNANAYPTVEITGPGLLTQLRNVNTGATIYFNYTLLGGEKATLVLNPAIWSFTSTFQGDVSGKILPGSSQNAFFLQPGANAIASFMTGTTAASSIVMRWRDAYQSVDAATP